MYWLDFAIGILQLIVFTYRAISSIIDQSSPHNAKYFFLETYFKRMLARVILQFFLPKRYQQHEVDLCRLALFARPDWDTKKVMWMDSQSKLKEIEPWALKQAIAGLENPEQANVRVEPSLAENAGDGVFCLNGAPAGTLLCVHPGTIHSATSVRLASEQGTGRLYERIFVNDLSHCVQLFDGTVIDAGNESQGEWQPHPFAVGHKCNHPPKGVLPNVMKCAFWWNPAPHVNVVFPGYPEKPKQESDDDDDDDQNVPERNIKSAEKLSLVEKIRKELGFTTSGSESGLVRGLGFVTTREVVPGEELFVNYRYNPKVTPPPWYHPVDVQEDEARWS